ncbi:MAG: nucleoid-associated protein YgaU [Saprospiraceae bacterium]|jgi:nucleoid-associated protein YgaU
MGLFSFLKNAGAKLMGKSAETNEAEAAASAAERANNLRSIIASSGVGIENLDVELDDDKVTVYGQTESVEDKEKIVLVAGNVEGIATVDDRISVVAPIQSRFHEVKPGDSLSKISKEVYGDPMKYDVIFEANKPMLSHPDKIYPGQMLRIPNL